MALSWQPSAEDCGFTGTNLEPGLCVVGYRLYWGYASGNYVASADLGHVTNHVFSGIIPGLPHYLVVTALNGEGGESDPSNEITFTAPAIVPTNAPATRLRLIARELRPKRVRFR